MADDSRSLTWKDAATPRAGLDERTKRTVLAGGSVLGAVAMGFPYVAPLLLQF